MTNLTALDEFIYVIIMINNVGLRYLLNGSSILTMILIKVLILKSPRKNSYCTLSQIMSIS